jgi:hypothetical protein
MPTRGLVAGLLLIVVGLVGGVAHSQKAPMVTSEKSAAAPSEMTEAFVEEIKKVERKMVAVAEDFPEKLYNTYRPTGNKDAETVAEMLLIVADFNATSAFQVSTKDQQRALSAANKVPDDRNFAFVSKQDTVGKVRESFAAVRKAIEDNPDPKNLEDWLFVISFSCEYYGKLVAYYQANGLTVPDARTK